MFSKKRSKSKSQQWSPQLYVSHDHERQLQQRLQQRLGVIHARQRLGIESDHHQRVFTRYGKFFHLENWYSGHALIRHGFRMLGLYHRGQRNSTDIQVRYNIFNLPQLPDAFDGLRILHLSDMHVDMYPPGIHALIERLRQLDYDLCVMTGDYRVRTYGDISKSMAILASIRNHLSGPIYAVLGNHDSIRMVPAMEDMGISLLLNENTLIEKDKQSIMLAGIDDAHFFRVDNIEKATGTEAMDNVKILLSHTPEVFRQAAHAGYDIFLCGHTHGGQVCLPGGVALTLDSRCPRFLGRGAWLYHGMQGYTSVGSGNSIVNLRFNCPPEITVHTLTKGNKTAGEARARI